MEYNNTTSKAYEQSSGNSRPEFLSTQYSLSPTRQYQQPPLQPQNTLSSNLVMHNYFPSNAASISAVHPTFASSSLPKLSAVQWDDENTYCFQVEAKDITVARRKDNNMINGTKLLNVVGMTRGKRDGILKNEIGRVVVKSGSMILKGVWITFERAIELSKEHNVYSMLFPLFESNIESYYYSPMLPFSTNPPEIDISSTRWASKAEAPSFNRQNTADSMSDMLQRPSYPTPANSYHGRTSVDLSGNPYANIPNSRSYSLDNLGSMHQRAPEYNMLQNSSTNQDPTSIYYSANSNYSVGNNNGYQVPMSSMPAESSFNSIPTNDIYTSSNYNLSSSRIQEPGKPLNCFFDSTIGSGYGFNPQPMMSNVNPSRSLVDRSYQESRINRQPSHPYKQNNHHSGSYTSTQHATIPSTPATTPTTDTHSGKMFPNRSMSLELPPPPTRFAVMKSGGNTPTDVTTSGHSFYPIPHQV